MGQPKGRGAVVARHRVAHLGGYICRSEYSAVGYFEKKWFCKNFVNRSRLVNGQYPKELIDEMFAVPNGLHQAGFAF